MRQDARYRDTSDAVDAITKQWRRERPELDVSAKEITGRIVRLASLIHQRYAAVFAPLGLSDGEYGLLAALRRSGSPFQLTPTDLARSQMMTSGGMTAVIDRLERRGLVERVPNPNDRRGSLVKLTEEGLQVVDEAMELHVAAEQEMLQQLPAAERERLERGLRALLLCLDAR